MKYFITLVMAILCLPVNAQTTEKGLDDRINEAFKPVSDFFS